MGKKYIIEIPEDKITDFVGSTHFLMPYMMAGHIGHHDTGLSIVPYAEPDLELIKEKAHTNGYSEGYQDGYSKGMNDYLQNPEVKEESDRAYAHGYSDAESKFSEIRKEAYEKGFKDAAHNCEETCTLVTKARNEGYNEGQRAGERHGKEVAWAAARKIQDAGGNLSWWIHNTTASEAIEGLNALEQEKDSEIKVGDEVTLKCGVRPAIYMQGTKGSDEIYLLFNDGSCGVHSKSEIERRTGRHFPEIATILEKMRGETREGEHGQEAVHQGDN